MTPKWLKYLCTSQWELPSADERRASLREFVARCDARGWTEGQIIAAAVVRASCIEIACGFRDVAFMPMAWIVIDLQVWLAVIILAIRATKGSVW